MKHLSKYIALFTPAALLAALALGQYGCGSRSGRSTSPEYAEADGEADSTDATTADELWIIGQDEPVEEIEITGTRIGRSNLESYAHIGVVSEDDIMMSAPDEEVEEIVVTGTRIGRTEIPVPPTSHHPMMYESSVKDRIASRKRNAQSPEESNQGSEKPKRRLRIPTSPALRAVRPGSEETVALPLKRTDVSARIDAYIATVKVEQQYHNPYAEKIEVIYVFPLPQDAAVSDFLMKIGDRTIRGIIRERKEAERIYREARSQGYTASLLTQERPNIFTQKVANIEPKKDIDIELTYFNTLPYRDGSYVFSFPTVVGPRFNPPGSTDGVGAVPHGADGESGQSTEVQYLPPGQGSDHRLSMSIDLEAGVAIEDVKSEAHEIEVERVSASRRKITLAQGATIPDRDFVLKYKVAGDKIKSAFLTHRDGDGGYFTLVLNPPDELKIIERSPVEHIFVLDCSGSMSGTPLDTAKDAVRRVLDKLTPDDTFQIIRFSSDSSALGRSPVPATKRNIERGLDYLDDLDSEGGTMMIEGIKAALDFPHSRGRVRVVSFMTDGYIGNEAEILGAIYEKLGYSRIFSFGVGTSVNRFLMERMAKVGQGAVAYVGIGDAESDEREVDEFYKRVSHPPLSDIEINWNGAEVSEVYPSRIPDLWTGRPVVITGRLTGRAPTEVTVRGRVGGQSVEFYVPVNGKSNAARPAIKQVWARSKIMELADRSFWSRDTDGLNNQIKTVALEYGLMSKFTAFVAVDSSRVTEGDTGYTVAQPVPVPHGVRYDTTVQE